MNQLRMARTAAPLLRPRDTARALLLAVVLAGCTADGLTDNANRPGVKVAEAALNGGSARVALQISQSILSRQPDDPTALTISGEALTQLGQNTDAATAFEHALRIAPSQPRAKLGLGRIRLTTDPAAAETLFRDVLVAEPANAKAMTNLGIALDLRGNHTEAREVYQRVLNNDPSNLAVRVNLALSLSMTGDTASALRLIEPLASDPSAPSKLRHNYAAILTMAGRDSEAAAVLKRDLSEKEVGQALAGYRQTRLIAVADAKPAPMPAAPVVATAAAGAKPALTVAVAKPAPTVAVAKAAIPAKQSTQMAEALPVPPRFVAPTPEPVPPAPTVTAVAAPMPNVIRPSEPETTVTVIETAATLPARPTVAERHVVTVSETGPTTAPEVPLAGSAAPPTEAERAAADARKPPSAPPVAAATVAEEPKPAPPAAAKPVKVAAAVPAQPPHRKPQSDAPRHTLDVQLGAFDSESAARAEWQRLKNRAPAAFEDRAPIFLKVDRDGTSFWRLRTTGFDGQDKARGFCAKLQAATSRCWVVGS